MVTTRRPPAARVVHPSRIQGGRPARSVHDRRAGPRLQDWAHGDHRPRSVSRSPGEKCLPRRPQRLRRVNAASLFGGSRPADLRRNCRSGPRSDPRARAPEPGADVPGPNLFPWLTVRRNIESGLVARGCLAPFPPRGRRVSRASSASSGFDAALSAPALRRDGPAGGPRPGSSSTTPASCCWTNRSGRPRPVHRGCGCRTRSCGLWPAAEDHDGLGRARHRRGDLHERPDRPR